MSDEIQLPELPRLQVPRLDADVDLMDIRQLVKWCERFAKDYARSAVLADRERRAQLASRGGVPDARWLDAVSGLVDDIEGLIDESEGVYGMHLNGDPSPWSELESGGRFERLTHLPIVKGLLAAQPAPGAWTKDAEYIAMARAALGQKEGA